MRILVLVCLACAPAISVAGQQSPPLRIPAHTGRFAEAEKAGSELPRLHSLLASVRGEVVLERYFNGARVARAANVKSVSKSVVSALVGVAIARGLVPGPEGPIRMYFPEISKDRDDRKQRITIEDLLTMRSGLESTSNRNYGAWVQSRNWVQHALAKPLFALPGTEMEYSTGNTHLLSAILTKATKTSTWQFAQDALARPLGFTLPRWPQDPQGIYFGGNDMLLTPRQMLAFGELYLRRGSVEGSDPFTKMQVIPEKWIEQSFVPRGVSRISGQRYGYGWWMRDLAGHQAYFAWGFGGQYIILVPDLDLVVVTTSASTVAEDRRTHRRTLFELVEDLVIAPVAATAAGYEALMQLLVSVANSAEACHAIDGGADLIDAKDPSAGALGAVSIDTLRQIHAVVQDRRVVSAALGDANDENTIERAAFEYGAVGVGFVKVGFAGITDPRRVERLLAAAVRGTHATGRTQCGVVAVAYADTGTATSVDPSALVQVAAHAGATGVLFDTALKDGPGLTRLVSLATLESWVATAHDAGLLVAVAGKLTADDLPFVCERDVDIVGVRGAACEGGRGGRVVAEKIRRLRECLITERGRVHAKEKTSNLQSVRR